MKETLKKIYKVLPSIWFYKLLRKFHTPSFYKYLTTKGTFSTKLENGESIKLMIDHSLYIEKEIFWNGLPCEFEPFTLKLWADLAKNAKSIFDIGANTGVFSVIANAYSQNGIVHAFEPVPYNCNVLERNIILNKFTTITVNKVAVSNKKGEAKMFVSDSSVNYVNTIHVNRSENNALKEVTVPIITLKDYLEEQSIKNIDLIKMDIEGHELEALEGIGKYLSLFKPTILIEILNNEMAELIETKFKELNYSFYLIDETEEALIEKQFIRTDGRVNFLLKPNI